MSSTHSPGDLTSTRFPDAYFDAITCLSVIEHGVPLEKYFKEMHRLLKPGGLLISSTDCYPTPIDTRGLVAYGSPIKIFSMPEIQNAITLAENIRMQRTGALNLEGGSKAVRWDLYGLGHTFLIFMLQKKAVNEMECDFG